MALRHFALGFVGLGMLAAPALSDDKISANYDVELGGARVLKAAYVASFKDGNYTAALDAKTTGMTKLFSKIKLNLSARGKWGKDGILPANYNYARKKNDKNKKRSLSFTTTGALVTDGTDYGEAILASLNGKVMDPLSMLLKLTRAEKPCSGKHRAFDGRDVFDISLSGESSDNDRVTCNLVYKPVAGGEFDEGDTDAVNYTITMVSMNGPMRYFPVEITGYTKGVPFTVSATGISVNGNPLAY